MKFKISAFFLLLYLCCYSQDGFHFEDNRRKIVIPFQSINNLIFITIKVNGIPLNFLLDSGSKETVLFGLENQDEISFKNAKKVKLKGFGYSESVDGLQSSNNNLSCNGFTDTNHELFVVLDPNFNFSTQIGIAVNGIMGSKFFGNCLLEINYEKNKIYVYKDSPKIRRKIANKFSEFPILIQNNRPYIKTKINISGKEIEAKMLIDTGNSDAVWLFENKENSIFVPEKNFEDYLGRGFSGEIFGKRSRLIKLGFHDFEFDNPLVAFPDSQAVKNSLIEDGNSGSIGSEILKRFTIVYDYKNQKIHLKKSDYFYSPFNYNMSGIEIEQDGLQWITETEDLNKSASNKISFDFAQDKIVNFRYKFSLKPVFKIYNIRKNSPAEASGLQKNDVVFSINKQDVYKYSLQEINELLKSEDGKTITIEVERLGKRLKFKFQLKVLL